MSCKGTINDNEKSDPWFQRKSKKTIGIESDCDVQEENLDLHHLSMAFCEKVSCDVAV